MAKPLASERFSGRCRVENSGCWIWIGPLDHNGYGKFRVRKKDLIAHRWSYEHHVGPIPLGLQLDHLCRNRACVNPAHLEPVAPRENVRRAMASGPPRIRPGAMNRNKTHCVHGHPFDEENTIWRKGRRDCRACGDRRRAAFQARHKAAAI